MVFGNCSGEFIGACWRERIVARGNARLKKVSEIGVHFMVVGEHVGLPGVKCFNPPSAFGMLDKYPVAVEVKPVVVGAPARPDFSMFPVFGVGNDLFAAVHVCPVCKATEAIGIGYGVEQDDGVGEEVVYGGTLRR